MASSADALYTLAVPREYGYVILTATSTFFLGLWHGARVGRYRRAARVPYPIPYAFPGTSAAAAAQQSSAPLDSVEKTHPAASASSALTAWGAGSEKDKYLFNCVQRAHAQFLEHQNQTVAALLVAGLKFPVTSSVMGIAWGVCRVLYAVGYTREDKEGGQGRLIGVGYSLFEIALFGMAGWTGWSVVAGK